MYFICRARLGLSDKEAGRLTYRQYLNLYRAYQNTFDVELTLTRARMTYEQLRLKAQENEEWL